ncbi:MAG TPA: DNA polymerase IV [Thermoanaerobaculia bacterium]|nr:DNA polymerase IV [Thermoanaerobaculia bacterium]
MRKIVHIDMDAFYAAVEQRDRPELRGKAVIVGGDPASRGVVCTASYEARKFGVHSAMPCSHAKRLCPDGIFVKPEFARYRAVSEQIREIFQRHTPLVEPLSLDEAYLDVTNELTGIPTATETAEKIREEIRNETGLTASAGVAPNKFLAKIASDWRKPDGIFVIKPHQIERFVAGLRIRKIPGVGPATERSLNSHDIVLVGDLLAFTPEALTDKFGSFGVRLWELARGIDESPVISSHERKSFSSENTFASDLTLAEVSTYLEEASRVLWQSASAKSLRGRTVTVKLRRSDFATATRRITPPIAPASASDLASIAVSLLERFDFGPAARFRLAGVGLSNFETDEAEGQTLLSSEGEPIQSELQTNG